MTSRAVSYETWLRMLGCVAAGGVVLSVAAFLLTSTTPNYRYLGGPGWQTIASPRFDPWSGHPHGRVWTFPNEAGVTNVVVEAVPDALAGRQAIPVPVGFAVGCVLTLACITVKDRRRRPGHRALGLAE